MQGTRSSSATGNAPFCPAAELSTLNPVNSGLAISASFQSNFGPRRRASSMESKFDALPGMLPAQCFLVPAILGGKGRLQLRIDQVADDADSAGSIDDMDHRLLVIGRNFDRGVRFARGRAANEKRQGKSLALHLPGHVRHFVQRRRDESAQPDHIGFLFAGGLQDFFARAP